MDQYRYLVPNFGSSNCYLRIDDWIKFNFLSPCINPDGRKKKQINLKIVFCVCVCVLPL